MKKRFCFLAAALVLILGLSVSAAAAETPDIQVQLDGQNLVFTDAKPQVRDQRTFLPYRAVFEAMGAEVAYEGNVVTAVRGDTALSMTIGETTATVTRSGQTETLTMDVAPYVDNTTWRTYVPVRFAADAFGCNVGWDQDAYTAIIVDVEKLLDEVTFNHSFTYMEKFLAYSQKYNTGLWDMDVTLEGSMDMGGVSLPFGATAVGTTQDSTKMDMDMNLTMDMTDLLEYLNQASKERGGETQSISPEEQALIDALANEGIGLSMRGDLSQGTFYMNMSGEILEQSGMPADTWYFMDMNAMLAGSGMDYAQLMEASTGLDHETLVKMILSSMELTDSTTGYAALKLMTDKVAGIFSDAAFIKDGNYAVNTFECAESGVGIKITLTLTMDGDTVVGYDLLCAADLADETGTAMSLMMRTSIDPEDNMEATLVMDLAEDMGIQFNMTGGYAQGKTAPVTEPPAGATVVDYMELLQDAA